MKSIYIVTGACGHLGNTIVRKLIDRGETVRGFALPSDPAEALPAGVVLTRGDVRDKDSMRPLFDRQADEQLIVIHTAAVISIRSRLTQALRQVNVQGVKNVVELCREYGARRLVYVSSVHALPEQPGHGQIAETDEFHPAWVKGAYAKTKAEATDYVLRQAEAGLDVVVVHPSGIIGPGDYGENHLNHMLRDCMTGKLRAAVKGGYNFVDVRDVADGCIAAADRGVKGECYILSGRHYDIKELLELVKEQGGNYRIRAYLPVGLAKLAAPFFQLADKVHRRQPLFTSYSMDTMKSNDHFSNKKARTQLGFRVRSMKETVRDTVSWLRAREKPKPAEGHESHKQTVKAAG